LTRSGSWPDAVLETKIHDLPNRFIFDPASPQVAIETQHVVIQGMDRRLVELLCSANADEVVPPREGFISWPNLIKTLPLSVEVRVLGSMQQSEQLQLLLRRVERSVRMSAPVQHQLVSIDGYWAGEQGWTPDPKLAMRSLEQADLGLQAFAATGVDVALLSGPPFALDKLPPFDLLEEVVNREVSRLVRGGASSQDLHAEIESWLQRQLHSMLRIRVVRVNYPGRPATTILAGGGGGCLGSQCGFSVLS